MRFHFSIRRKFVFAFLGLSVTPLILLGGFALNSIRVLGERAVESSSAQLEQRARDALELRAIELADQVARFLRACETDLLSLKLMPRTAEVYARFAAIHTRRVWTRAGTNARPLEVREDVPLYREIAFVGPNGREQVRIDSDGPAAGEALRDVSRPENTTYKTECYFDQARRLRDGEVFTSHVTGWHVTLSEQLRGARSPEEAVEGRRYQGLVRFATPCYGPGGGFEGVLVLSLDHRHLMEFTQHILPTEERFVVFPSYSSGNYAFMFDDEGWIIAHPKYNDIRGLAADGSFFDPSGPSYSRERLLAGELPFNLDYVAFINPNYPIIAEEVRRGRSGVTKTFNVGGVPRVMAYAPIFYQSRPYDRYGIFGGITIGVETRKFSEPAAFTRGRIEDMVANTKRHSLVILAVTAASALLLAFLLSRRFTEPILKLAAKAREIGSSRERVEGVMVKTGDELELLATNLTEMARDIRSYQESLRASMTDLAQSKATLEERSQQLEKQLRILKNVHFVSHYLSTGYDRESVLHTVLKSCAEGLGYDRVVLFLLDHGGRRLSCHKSFGLSSEQERRALAVSYDVQRDDGVLTRVLRSGRSRFIADLRRDPEATPLDLKMAAGGDLKAVVFTPLKSRDRVIGVLGADTRRSRREISALDVECLEIFANDAARAIELSELYNRLVTERNFVRSLVTHMTAGIITLDESGRATWFNPYAEAVLGIRKEEAMGQSFRDILAEYPQLAALVDRHFALPVGEVMTLEETIPVEGEDEKVLELHLSVIQQEQRPQRIFLMLFRDITRRRKMEDHVRRSDRLVSLGILAAGIAHEMRNPLTGVSLLLDDLHDRLNDRPQERDLIGKSLQEIDRLESLIAGLLDFAAPGRRISLRPTPLAAIVENTLFLVRKLCKNRGVTVAVEGADKLPPIPLDPDKIKQALLNLLLNAVQAMPEGGRIEVALAPVTAEESSLARPALRIEVSDTGLGIAEADLPFIFDPFFSRNPAGSGLGLAIVHTIVEEHQGRIDVFSREHEGTRFQIDLPLDPDEPRGRAS